jgi:hypothetical protein
MWYVLPESLPLPIPMGATPSSYHFGDEKPPSDDQAESPLDSGDDEEYRKPAAHDTDDEAMLDVLREDSSFWSLLQSAEKEGVAMAMLLEETSNEPPSVNNEALTRQSAYDGKDDSDYKKVETCVDKDNNAESDVNFNAGHLLASPVSDFSNRSLVVQHLKEQYVPFRKMDEAAIIRLLEMGARTGLQPRVTLIDGPSVKQKPLVLQKRTRKKRGAYKQGHKDSWTCCISKASHTASPNASENKRNRTRQFNEHMLEVHDIEFKRTSAGIVEVSVFSRYT